MVAGRVSFTAEICSRKAAAPRRVFSGARLLRAFAGLEVALSLVLLIGAGLLFDHLNSTQQVDLGFDPRNLYSVRLIVPYERKISDADLTALYDRLLANVSSKSGLHDASLTSLLTPDWGNNSWVFPDAKRDPRTEREFVETRSISPGYFRLMKVPFLAGHLPTAMRSSRDPTNLWSSTILPPGNTGRKATRWDRGSRWAKSTAPGIAWSGSSETIATPVPRVQFAPSSMLSIALTPSNTFTLAVRSTLPQPRIAELLHSAVSGDRSDPLVLRSG